MLFFTYVKDSFRELTDNVTWLGKLEVQKTTLVVAVFTVIFALLIFLIDKVFQNTLTNFFNIF